MEYLEAYRLTIIAGGVMGVLLLVQLLIADVVSIRSKHTPGHAVPADHDSLLFRASRAFANTNESIAIFILFAAFGIASGGDPRWLNASSAVYVVGRLLHMLCYYANLKHPRSAAFGLALLGLIGMLLASVWRWVS